MLPSSHRLTRKEFPVFSTPHVKKMTKIGLIRYYPIGDSVKVSVIVAKKIAKKSVDRHRIKRLIYIAFSKILKLIPPGKYICTVSSDARTVPLDQIIEIIRIELIEK